MNVGELRLALSEFPDDMEVMYDDPDNYGPFSIESVRDFTPEWSVLTARIMAPLGLRPQPVVMLS